MILLQLDLRSTSAMERWLILLSQDRELFLLELPHAALFLHQEVRRHTWSTHPGDEVTALGSYNLGPEVVVGSPVPITLTMVFYVMYQVK
jgi:hypothetical protein